LKKSSKRSLKMPVYQFICLACRVGFEKSISFKEYGTIPISCPHCQSHHVQRKIGKVRINRDAAHADDFSVDPAAFSELEEDPRSMGKMMRKMEEQTGEKFEPEFNEVIDRLEKGQTFEQIEKELPDINPPSSTLS